MDVAWHTGMSGDVGLRAHLLRSCGWDVDLGRHCPACGSDRHGRPWARLSDGSRPHVSLARCGDHVVTAVDPLRPVGVDVEEIAAVDARWDPDLVLHPGERAGSQCLAVQREAADAAEQVPHPGRLGLLGPVAGRVAGGHDPTVGDGERVDVLGAGRPGRSGEQHRARVAHHLSSLGRWSVVAGPPVPRPATSDP